MQHLTERHRAELVYQEERARTIAAIGPTPDYIIERYRVHRWWRLFPKEFMFQCLGDIAGKTILDFGCGEGEITTQLAKLGAEVTGVDISPELIAITERRTVLDGLQDRTRLIVADVTKSALPDGAFDVVICHAVLHHVDIYEVVPPLLATLKPGGVAIVVEPVTFSPLLQRFRALVPIAKEASPAERQLSGKEVAYLLDTFADSRITFFNLFGRLIRFFPNRNKIDHGHPFTKAAIVMLLSLDRLLLALFPFLWRFCGIVVIVGKKPADAGRAVGTVHRKLRGCPCVGSPAS